MRLDSLVFTDQFLEDLGSFNKQDQRLVRRALALLHENEKHPSLNVHQLMGEFKGVWTAYASRQLRMTFERLPKGKKAMLTCSRHYGD